MQPQQPKRSPVTCRPQDSLDHVARLMQDHDCNSIAVVDEDGQVVGVITERDVCLGALYQGKPLHDILVVHAHH
jgi:CBS domain-containing protein